MRDKIFSNQEAVLRLSLDQPEAKTIYVVSYDLAHFENRPSEVHDGVEHIKWKNGLMKVVKGSAITDFLASRALEDYKPLNFDFSNEDLVYVTTTEKVLRKNTPKN
ncbi:hypothetical protein EPI10_015535 [Gossypium australe]|uniref:Uncharacterized protein n=1 Tax=Gossypium australe TaxID=47621 RepID=A0A5B6VKE3_9ROSI|nr:hypothetical protein EPI10_015535 [Gossypium australe]